MSKLIQLNELQKAFVLHAKDKKSLLLRANTGQGKTICSLALYAFFRKVLGFKHMIVIAKTKTLGAFEKNNLQHLSITKIVNQTDLNVFHAHSTHPSELYLISAGQLNNLINLGSEEQKRSFQELLKQPGFLVIDELSDYRNIVSSSINKSLIKVTN